MNRDLISEAVGGIDDRFLAEALAAAPDSAAGPSERKESMKIKRIVTLALAAALLLSLGIVAHAAYSAVSTPEAAEKVAREQIEVWKEMGILAPEVEFVGDADQIVEIEAEKGGDYWYGRLFPHSYDVRWFAARDGDKYGCNLRVDTMTGKIIYGSIDARADEEEDEPVYIETMQAPLDPRDPEGEQRNVPLTFYKNFDDIVPADMTVDRFCELLAEYWGFSGYTLAETVDDSFYQKSWEAVDGSTLVTEIPTDVRDEYYLTIFFDGDQEGAPMYLQLNMFHSYVNLSLGTGHAVG